MQRTSTRIIDALHTPQQGFIQIERVCPDHPDAAPRRSRARAKREADANGLDLKEKRDVRVPIGMGQFWLKRARPPLCVKRRPRSSDAERHPPTSSVPFGALRSGRLDCPWSGSWINPRPRPEERPRPAHNQLHDLFGSLVHTLSDLADRQHGIEMPVQRRTLVGTEGLQPGPFSGHAESSARSPGNWGERSLASWSALWRRTRLAIVARLRAATCAAAPRSDPP